MNSHNRIPPFLSLKTFYDSLPPNLLQYISQYVSYTDFENAGIVNGTNNRCYGTIGSVRITRVGIIHWEKIIYAGLFEIGRRNIILVTSIADV